MTSRFNFGRDGCVVTAGPVGPMSTLAPSHQWCTHSSSHCHGDTNSNPADTAGLVTVARVIRNRVCKMWKDQETSFSEITDVNGNKERKQSEKKSPQKEQRLSFTVHVLLVKQVYVPIQAILPDDDAFYDLPFVACANPYLLSSQMLCFTYISPASLHIRWVCFGMKNQSALFLMKHVEEVQKNCTYWWNMGKL